MLTDATRDIVWATLAFLAVMFQVAVGTALLAVVVVYVVDRTQTRHALRRNYPVIGRFRYLLEYLGEFFRQYFFAMDREELPFNRAQRSWCYRAAKNVDRTVAFGSTRDIRSPGTVLFVNCPYPTLDEDAVAPGEVIIGPGCRSPYVTRSIFNVSAMSYGAISQPAVTALARGARLAGCWMNTGEGGLSPYHLEGGCDLVFQIGTARYGVRDADGRLSDERLRSVAAHPQVRMFEIKLSQGAKPGKGGILPAGKVTPEVAVIRGISPRRDSISPNRHPEVKDDASLLDLVSHVREVTGKPVGIKFVLGARGWVDGLLGEVLARGIDQAPDFLTVDGAEGGTGAAPQALIDDMGLPLRESLPLVVDAVRAHGLSGRVRIVASGKLVTPTDIAWALCMGADFVASARLHVRAGLHPGPAVQPQHLPHRHHDPRPAPAARTGAGGEVAKSDELPPQCRTRPVRARPRLRRALAARTQALPCTCGPAERTLGRSRRTAPAASRNGGSGASGVPASTLSRFCCGGCGLPGLPAT